MYPPELVKPMKADLTTVGFQELTSSQDVDQYIQNANGSFLLVVNSHSQPCRPRLDLGV